MTPTASAHTIVISPGTKLISVSNPSNVGMAFSEESAILPKYAIGLFESNGNGPRKRKRLTHLTPEEKVMRRKLKNRVAAQTARDRKRLKMETLEETVQKIQLQAKELLDVNLKLLERAEALERENAELRHRLGLSIDENPVVSGNRREMERIKIEFDDTVAINFHSAVPESILSPDESSDESENGSRISYDRSDELRTRSNGVATTKCASPEPAAGSCQTLVDPLRSRNTDFSCSSAVGTDPPDILNLLEKIGSNIETKDENSCRASESSRLNSSPTSDSRITPEQLESIKELINVDHLYSKPNTHSKCNNKSTKADRPSFKIQLSGSIPSTKLIKQPKDNLNVKKENKPIVLFEDFAQKLRTVQPKSGIFRNSRRTCDNQTLISNSDPRPLISEQIDFETPTVASDLYLENIDAELDSILNDQCGSTDMPLVSPFDLDFSSSSESDCSSLPSQPSASTPIDTPLVTDMLDPFDDSFNSDETFYNGSFSAELFPQLSAVI